VPARSRAATGRRIATRSRGAKRSRRPRSAPTTDLPIEGLPIVAIVGRPNVGKSTLFNRLVGERRAVVEDRARTTRDRLYGDADWNDRRFIVVDTGGLERRPGDPIEEKVQDQARLAIAEADAILFVVDAEAGETPADAEAAELLRRSKAPVFVVVNKADNPRRDVEAAEFHRLGWPETHPISALHGRGTGDLLDALVEALPPEAEAEIERKRQELEEATRLAEEDDGAADSTVLTAPSTAEEEAWDLQVAADESRVTGPVGIAIVGRPNVGKSSLLNQLLGEERAIVSDIPGTTRDAIDTTLEWNGQHIRLIDTAGIRRRGKVAGSQAAERFSALRALKAISRADVAVLVLDAVDGLTAQDAHVAGYVVEEGKGLIIAINKWDLVEKDQYTFDAYASRIRSEAPFLDFAPILAISAKSGLRVGRVLEAAIEISGERKRRVPTAELNRVLRDAAFRQDPPMVKGRRPKLYYGTQASVAPPTFAIFASDAAAVHFSYRRYLENQFRAAFGFSGTPIRLVFRNRSRADLPRARARAAGLGNGRRARSASRPHRSGRR
jgi:GTP-binding protein